MTNYFILLLYRHKFVLEYNRQRHLSMFKRLTQYLLMLTSCCLLAACSNKDDVVVAGPVVDITRPPVMVKATPKPEAEAPAAGEAISYDEWRKQQEEQTQPATP